MSRETVYPADVHVKDPDPSRSCSYGLADGARKVNIHIDIFRYVKLTAAVTDAPVNVRYQWVRRFIEN